MTIKFLRKFSVLTPLALATLCVTIMAATSTLKLTYVSAQGAPASTEKKKSGWADTLDAILNPKTNSTAGKASNTTTLESTTKPPLANAEEQQGTIVVAADSALGSKFRNIGKQAFVMEIFANGRWAIGPNSGYCGANGHPERPKAEAGYRMPNAPLGTLIVRRGSGAYELIGGNKTLRVLPRETVYFCINDSDGGHGDNTGKVKIEWTGDYEAE